MFLEGVDDNKSIFFIDDGEISIVQDDQKGIPLLHLRKGEYFGELSFITEKRRNFSAISHGFSSLYYITRTDFLSILKANPVDYEEFCYFKDEIEYNDNYKFSELKCLACNLKGHTVENFKKIHIEINKTKVCNKFYFSIPIKDRSVFQRKKKKFNSKINIKNIQEKYNNFIAMNSQIFNDEDSSDTSELYLEDYEEKFEPNSNNETKIDNSNKKKFIRE